MKRRTFIKRALPVAIMPFLINGISMKAFGSGSAFGQLLRSAPENNKVLVIIQLAGGNDGLNTVIPLDQYSALSTARANILIPENLVLSVNATNVTGLHPAMPEIQTLFNNNQAMVIQAVSYPNPNFSHFEATDIWMTASPDLTLETGWVGRYLDNENPNYPTGYPNAQTPDPLALQIGSVVSTTLQGPAVSMGIAITSTTDFYQLTTGAYPAVPSTPAGHELTFIRETATQTQQYTSTIQSAANAQQNLSQLYPAPGKNPLADQLKIVAQLIGGGLQTKVYMVSLGSFDFHAAQVAATGGNQTGQHANILGNLSVAVNAFMDDITLMNQQDRVIGMTFSEFGRRIISNGSQGTDHGTAEPVFLFGSQVKGGFVGTNPVIPANANVNDNIAMQTDFRSVYASVLQNWFCIPSTELISTMGQSYPTLDLFTSGCSTTAINNVSPVSNISVRNYPNPAGASTIIEFQTTGGNISIKLYDEVGHEVETIANGSYNAGMYQINMDTQNLPKGIYFYTLIQGEQKVTNRLLVM